MRFLFIGDVVSKVGRQMILDNLKKIKEKYDIDIVIANGENAAHGRGISLNSYNSLIDMGVNVITLGNHFNSCNKSNNFYVNATKLIRPLNIHPSATGFGTRVFDYNNINFRVTNILGRVFINALNPQNPFDVLDELLPKCKEKIHIIDFHGEATGEKMAFAWNFDGKVSAILGTHTHVQTIDNRILPSGTAYISDVGMTGPYDGIIGAKKEEIIFKTRTGLPAKFDVETGRGQLNAVVLDIDNETGKALSIKRVYISPDYIEGI